MPKYQDFLTRENQRNHDSKETCRRFLVRALKDPNVEVLVAHHIVFCQGEGEPNEIPSIDTLIFDPEMMHEVFGSQATTIMLTLAKRGVDTRDKVFKDFLDALDLEDKSSAAA
jgi:hypothetical protein